MKVISLLLLCCHSAFAVPHTLQYFYTGSRGLADFPPFVAVGIVDGQQIDYYDSVSEKNVLKQAWMEGVRDENDITNIRRGIQQTFAVSVGIVMQRFNQTTGVHTVQRMVGCEWDDETGEVSGYNQDAYDGEDFISFDLKTKTWTAPVQQALITKHKWDRNTAQNEYWNNYLTQTCIKWLQKYVGYGSSTLQRKVLPSVSLLQKSPSSPVTCHATGFHPDKVMLFWRRDGEEVHEDVDHGETLHNHDGTFQRSVDLDVSSVQPGDWKRYDCVFQLSGEEDIVIKLDAAVIKTNWGREIRSDTGSSSGFPAAAVIGVVVGLLLLAVCMAGVFMWRRRSNGFKPANTSEGSTSSADSLIPG